MSDGPMSPEQNLARRTILKGASLGVGAGLASALTAQAQSNGAGGGSDRAIWGGGILGQEGRGCAQSLAQARWRPQDRRNATSDSVPGARLFELGARVIRSQRPRPGRVLTHECIRALRLRRVDHGSRRLWPLGQFG